jgi:hypothetical protein
VLAAVADGGCGGGGGWQWVAIGGSNVGKVVGKII